MAPDSHTRSRPALKIEVSDARGRSAAPGLAAWLTRIAPAAAKGTVNVALVSDVRVRALNRQYRGIDAATDVLSFPAASGPRSGSAGRRADAGPAGALLGDIVIAQGVARRQARAVGHPEATELRVLALHGLLHLLGYDHEHDRGTMARLERRLRRKGGLREGLIERQ
jgi:probable rRNA maturation factor